jgi:hypothetical protein
LADMVVGMRNRILVVALCALLLSGCPAGGFFGRYLIVNNTDSTITNLEISVRSGMKKAWDQTLPGQGWMHSDAFPDKSLIVSWSDATGTFKKEFSFEKKTAYRSEADLYIELNSHGNLAWRVIEPPREDSTAWAIVSLIPVYIFYCLAVALLLGVPLAWAAVIAYGLFKAIQTGIDAAGPGLCGGRSIFQFTIREIMLLTTVAALVFGWFVQLWAS